MLTKTNGVRRCALALSVSLALGMTLGLAGCGGGGSSVKAMTPPPPPPPPPPPAPPPESAPLDGIIAGVNAKGLAAAGHTGEGQTIAIVFTGANGDHPALTPRVVASKNFLDCTTVDYCKNANSRGQGTAVAEIAAGQALGKTYGNWPGGIAPGADLVSAQFACATGAGPDATSDPCGSNGASASGHFGGANGYETSDATFIKQVNDYVVDQHAKIMNNSWGGDFDKANASAVASAFADAYTPFVTQHDGLVVFAAGDTGADNPTDLASLPTVANDRDLERGWLVGVAAATPDDPTQLAADSNQCGRAKNYCLTVPVDGLLVSPYQGFEGKSGWSLYPVSGTASAAPQIAGVAALVWQAFPYFNNDKVRQTLLGTATDLGAPGVDKVFGWGMLNAGKAVKGPAQFAWGDFNVSFDSIKSIWSNDISGAGGLVKGGTGTLVLAGNDTYTDGTTINAGTLQVGNGGETGSITGNVTDNGTLVFDRSDDLTYTGIISGSGTVVQAGVSPDSKNPAVLTLIGANTYTGATTINSGTTLQVGNGGTTGSLGTGGVVDNGTLTFNHSDDVTYDGVVSGSGVLTKAGSGTLILTGINTYTGGTRISAGTLQIGDGGATGSIAQRTFSMANDTTLVFDSSSDLALGNFGGSGNQQGVHATLVQQGTGTLILQGNIAAIIGITVKPGTTLQVGNGATTASTLHIDGDVTNDGSVVVDSNGSVSLAGAISGTGSLTQSGPGTTTLTGTNTYTGGTAVNAGTLSATTAVPGDVTVGSGGTLDAVPGVAGNLTSSGIVAIHGGNTTVGGDFTQAATGTLAVSLGSTLAVTGTATLNGGTLEVTGADDGYQANTHTDVLTASGGLTGTFDTLVKDPGVVFTSTTIHYDYTTNEVYLDTTGLDITVAAAGEGVYYTPASMGSAVRVQGAFDQLNGKIASGDVGGVSGGFLHNAGLFQHVRGLRAAQASLKSLSGELHAASAGMTLHAIDTTSRALSDRLEQLIGNAGKVHVWVRQLNLGGDMSRSGYANVNYQLYGWLVGTDTRLGPHTLAGFALRQGSGVENLVGRFDRNRSYDTAGMAYAGWFGQHWYLHGRVGTGYYRQHMQRLLRLGPSYQGVWSDYTGYYNVARGESGRHFRVGVMQLTPFAALEYDRVTRSGFVEHGAGGFGLKADAQTLSRWQGGVGVKLAHQWTFAPGRALSFDARLERRQTLAASGAVFDASFVGLDTWRPLTGVGLSRRSTVFGLDLNATLAPNTRVRFGYEYLTGDRGRAAVASARFTLRF